MGQSPSSVRTKGGRQRSFRSFTRRNKLNKSGLSHAFNLPPSEEYAELMNINTATEEQLMTLPGVSRQLAREIVRHRQMIGRFKRVDDLALVSGIGAEKLESLRPEICTRKQVSRTSSCTQSLDSIRLVPETKDSKLCSVNSSSVFQLQCVPGLNQELAANIVDHRNRKGPFKSLDDLIKVRGMDIVRLSTVKPHLTLELRKCESVQSLNHKHTNGLNGFPVMNGSINAISTPKSPHRKTLSMPTKFPMTMTLPNGFANAPVNDILDLLSAYSHRPIVEEVFTYERNGVRCCRIATWNLHQLGVDKIMNPGVREVVCRTILENKLSLIAIQDVLDEAALKITIDELNGPTLRRVKEWKANSFRWEYCVSQKFGSQHLGFIFDTSTKGITIEDIDLDQLCLLCKTSEASAVTRLVGELADLRNERYIASPQAFILCDRPLLVINISCQSCLSESDVDRLRKVADLAPSSLQLVFMGEFLTWDNIASLKSCHPLTTEDTSTTVDISNAGKSSILRPLTDKNFNGYSGVVKSGLSHLAIPRGWSWGGPASPYCPIWAEINAPQCPTVIDDCVPNKLVININH